MITKHSGSLKDKRIHHSAAMMKHHKKLQALQKLVLQLKDVMIAEKQEAATLAEKFELGEKEATKIINAKNNQICMLTERATSTKQNMKDWTTKYDALKNELATQSIVEISEGNDASSQDVDVLSEEIEQ